MITRSEHNWTSASGVRDRNNVRLIDFDDWDTVRIGNTKPVTFTHTVNANDYKNITDGCMVSTFMEDYILERFWNKPHKYAKTFSCASLCMTPDFSLLVGMPTEMAMWQVYRNRFVGRMWEGHGIDIVPTVSWADSRTFPYICSNIRHGSTIAVSNVGCKDKEGKRYFDAGLDYVLKELNPQTVIFQCNNTFKKEYTDSNIVFIEPFWEAKRKRHGRA